MAEGTVRIDAESLRDGHIASNASIQRSKLAQRVLAVINIPPQDWRIWNALATVLTGTANTDDLALDNGTFGTTPPSISTGDVKASTTTRYARTLVSLPADYEDGQTVSIRVTSGMTTTVADTSATVDLEVWRIDEDGTLGAADICATSAQSINSLTEGTDTFTITAATLLAGDMLDVRLAVAVVDAATATAVIGSIWKVELLCDLR